jgi:hypothetical protein
MVISSPRLTAWLLLAPLPLFAADPPGDLWEVTSQMEMPGMPMKMPAQTSRVCAAKEWKQPPAGANPRQQCTRSDFSISGNKATWTETCESPAMTGKGEITRDGSDAYTGKLTYSSPDGNMTINLKGKKVGDCDNPS